MASFIAASIQEWMQLLIEFANRYPWCLAGALNKNEYELNRFGLSHSWHESQSSASAVMQYFYGRTFCRHAWPIGQLDGSSRMVVPPI
jgi:hypothetical protein